MSFVDAFENVVLDEILGASATLLTGTVKVGLSTTTPTDAGGNITEPGFGYAKVVVTNDGTEWAAAANGEKKNTNTITFPAASGGAWGVITHWALYDSSDVVKIWGVIDDGAGTPTPKTVTDGDQFRFLANQLRITLD